MENSGSEESKNSPSSFEKDIARLPNDLKDKILDKEKKFKKLVDAISEKVKEKSMGFYLTAEIEMVNNVPKANFDKLTLHFLLDDFDKPIQYFDPRILLAEEFDKLLLEKKGTDQQGEYVDFYLKEDENIRFIGSSISILRENCFDSIYDDLKMLGSSLIYRDERGFLSALKTIDIHRNMLLQKFEKYVVVYAGAGSWLRGEKSNDFDVFIVIDDTDVKRMSRLQVKDQLTKIIWQMSREVAAVTGIQIHIQVYLLTDFWDALKDAHPVMFTFLRDGVPFYDRGLYSAWKELLKLGKIRPSPEAIDMHMNVGTQLIDRAKKMLADIVMNEIYYAFLNPSQAILMLKGYNPTTPKETVRMFKEVLLQKEKSISAKDVEAFEHAVKMFKEIEHNRDTEVSGKEIDKMIKDADAYLQHIKKMFEEISEERTKESIVSSYNELLNQIKVLPGLSDKKDKELVSAFEKEYLDSGVFPSFVKSSFKEIQKAKSDYDKDKISGTEVNKVLKEIRNVLSEIKSYREKSFLSEANRKKLFLYYDKDKMVEVLLYESRTYMFDQSSGKLYVFNKDKFEDAQIKREDLFDNSKIGSLKLGEELIKAAKKILGVKEFSL